MLRYLKTFLTGLLLVAVPAGLSVFAVPRFAESASSPSVTGVETDRLFAHEVPRGRLARANRDLRQIAPGDGDALAWRAEIDALLAGSSDAALERARATLLEGLSHAPANPRAWTLLCEIDIRIHRDRAASCMDTAFYVGPFDWFLAERRTVLSAWLWPQLDRDTQDAAARRLHLIWDDPRLHWIALEAGLEPNGAALVTAAFAHDNASLAAFERELREQPALRSTRSSP